MALPICEIFQRGVWHSDIDRSYYFEVRVAEEKEASVWCTTDKI